MDTFVYHVYGCEPEETLWRYMDIFRLMDLLQTSELHMTRADQMEDQWEGSRGVVLGDMGMSVQDESSMNSDLPTELSTLERMAVFLNSWYRGEGESYAMWKLYGAAGKGVAVKTTLSRLERALKPVEGYNYICGAAVQYVDYWKTQIPEKTMLDKFAHKRQCYDYEKEYRLLEVMNPEDMMPREDNDDQSMVRVEIPPYRRRPVDLKILIDSIYISPETPSWVAATSERMIKDYAPWVNVVYSDLGEPPRR